MARGRQAARVLTAEADWREERPGGYVFTQASTTDQDAQIEAKTGGNG